MKKFIETLRNIWSIEELRSKILITLLLVFVYIIGTYIVLPGIDANALQAMKQKSNDGLLGLINIFSGGAFANASIFALGIMPYISASIAVQLLSLAVPYFQRLSREGESGRRQINQITRYLTIAVTTVQGMAYITNLKTQSPEAITQAVPYAFFVVSSLICLSAGTLFVMWLGERITDKGLGNGISLIIMVGIISRLPGAFLQEIAARFTSNGMMIWVLEIAFFVVVLMGIILLVQGTRRIPVQYAKRNIMQNGRMMQAGGNRQYLPLKVNQAGVMPIIFAQALMFLPATLLQLYPNTTNTFIKSFTDHNSWIYNTVVFLLIMIFTYFYTALVINPTQMADEMKKNGGFIPGVSPGKKTAEYIDNVISRITLPGSILLAIVAIMPAIVHIFGVQQGFAYFFGGTSILIMVGTILDTLQQVESHLLMKKYDGLTKGGRIKGRQGLASVGGGY
ncbi:MAG: preprotein translocase subunit SecY [Bacteroidota bacterium]